MNQKGYDVKYTFEPMAGRKGEYYIYVVVDGNKKIVFSNSKNHTDVIYNSGIKPQIYGQIISKIIAASKK